MLKKVSGPFLNECIALHQSWEEISTNKNMVMKKIMVNFFSLDFLHLTLNSPLPRLNFGLFLRLTVNLIETLLLAISACSVSYSNRSKSTCLRIPKLPFVAFTILVRDLSLFILSPGGWKISRSIVKINWSPNKHYLFLRLPLNTVVVTFSILCTSLKNL